MFYYCLTDIGKKREINEDYLFASDSAVGPLPDIYIVADGMGGANAGEYASEHTVRGVLDQISTVSALPGGDPVAGVAGVLQDAIVATNRQINLIADTDPDKSGMGTTLVVAVIYEDHLIIANVGDSRCYALAGEDLKQLTIDHSYVEEMVRRGEMTPEMARVSKYKNRITRAIGAEPEVQVDFFDVKLDGISRILLCTDGLTNMLTDDQIEEILADGTSVKRQTERLLSDALLAGGLDNITIMNIDPRGGLL